MRRRYWALWVFSFVLEWLGVCVWAIAGFFILYILIAGQGYSANPADSFSMLVYQMMMLGVWRILFGGALIGLALLALGQLISLLMDLEENTRAQRLIIRERENAPKQQARNMWEEP